MARDIQNEHLTSAGRARGRHPVARNREVRPLELGPVPVHSHHDPVANEQGLPARPGVHLRGQPRRRLGRPGEGLFDILEQQLLLPVGKVKQRLAVQTHAILVIGQGADQAVKHGQIHRNSACRLYICCGAAQKTIELIELC